MKRSFQSLQSMSLEVAGRLVHYCGFLLLALLLLVGHLFLPCTAFVFSPRDSDMGLWFCGGVVLSELSFLGMICSWRFGQLQWRILVGAAFNVMLLLIVLIAASLLADMSKHDAITLLILLAGWSLFASVFDLAFGRCFGISLVPKNLSEEQMEPDEPQARPFRFSLFFLLLCVALSAAMALMVSQSLTLRSASYRSFRSYYNQGAPFLLLLATFKWVLHSTLLFATLTRRVTIGFFAVGAIATLGTEAIRRTEEWKNGVKLDYLNWEFSMIVFGFIVAHFVIGFTIRWLGWELRRVVVNTVPNTVPKKGKLDYPSN